MSDNILIVDDETDICMLLENILQDEGYETRSVNNDLDALNQIREKRPSLIVLDIWLEGSKMDGLQLLEVIKREYSNVPVIMISGHGTIQAAVTAIKRGAFDFIEKPFKAERLLLVINRALEDFKLRREIEDLRLHAGKETELGGPSAAIQTVISDIHKMAPTNSRVLIEGAPGTGKEVAARMIHRNSQYTNGPFVTFNCAITRSDQIEVELFGVEPKSGSKEPRRIGIFEKAHGGTLYLDEISDLPLSVQMKLLKVLQEQNFKRIGGNEKIPINFRVISSTNRDLRELIEIGKFREDLLYRLNIIVLKMPTLSTRREDIPFLAKHFMERTAANTGRQPRLLASDVVTALQAYDWPGNVRQLKNIIEWLLIMAPNEPHESIKADVLPPEFHGQQTSVANWDKSSEVLDLSLREAREMFEKDYLLAQVRRFGGNISKTAEFIGMERSALHRKLRSLGVNYNDRKQSPKTAAESLGIDSRPLSERDIEERKVS